MKYYKENRRELRDRIERGYNWLIRFDFDGVVRGSYKSTDGRKYTLFNNPQKLLHFGKSRSGPSIVRI